MNRLQRQVMAKKILERRRTLQHRHLQPVVNKVLVEAMEVSQPNQLVVPKTSLEGMGRLSPQVDVNVGFTAQREKNRADQASNQVASLAGQLEAIQRAGTVGTQYNLTPDEVTTGAQLIASYKDNPVQTIQYLLTQAQANGHNVDAIVSGGTDVAAVKQMLDRALAPLVQDRQAQLDTQNTNAAALEIYNQFSGRFPDASVHEGTLARLLQDDPNLSPEAAYYKLQNFYLQKGWDWTKSLDQLMQEAATTTRVNTQPQPPDCGGVTARNVTDTAQVADVNTSTDDIIRQAMAEAGITI